MNCGLIFIIQTGIPNATDIAVAIEAMGTDVLLVQDVDPKVEYTFELSARPYTPQLYDTERPVSSTEFLRNFGKKRPHWER